MKEKNSLTDASFKNRTILFVDDEEVNIVVGEAVLSRLGYQFISAHNGMEAFNIYKSRKDEICLIIMDMNMPLMDGEECIREIRKLDTEVKIIVCTGYINKSQSHELDDMGLSATIIKPYRAEALRDAIDAVL